MKYFLRANWENLIMANYALAPEVLLPYLPKGVELDLHEGKAYASLVGFMFKKTSIFGIPIPFLGTFEEVNLRFYVKRTVDNEVRRGVVFVNETVPYKAVAWLANKLYKEHYTAVPTKHTWQIENDLKTITYQWKIKGAWESLAVKAKTEKQKMSVAGFEEFIFEHYYGYTRVSENSSLEYYIEHPRWEINEVLSYEINCDFEKMYGAAFAFLKTTQPHSVFLAEGSPIAIKWKRNRF